MQDSPWLWSDTFLLSLGTCRGECRVWFILHLGQGSCSSSPAGLWSISHQGPLCVSKLACSSCTLFPPSVFSHQAFEPKIKTNKLSDKCYLLAELILSCFSISFTAKLLQSFKNETQIKIKLYIFKPLTSFEGLFVHCSITWSPSSKNLKVTSAWVCVVGRGTLNEWEETAEEENKLLCSNTSVS